MRKEEWDKILEQLILFFTVFTTVNNKFSQDYELLKPSAIPHISYNKLKLATALKSFFTPVTENVISVITAKKPRIIIGIPSCDIEGLYHVTRYDKYHLIFLYGNISFISIL